MNQSDIDHIQECIAKCAEFAAEIEASRYWVLTIVYPIRGAVHYTCRTREGCLDIVGENVANLEEVKFYIKRHTFADC